MHRRARGVTYLALLLAVALTSGALAAGTVVWSHQQRRERETQLLWAGDQIRRAIESYAAATPEGMARHPARLEDLLDDARSLVPRHHLRRIYHDPMNHGTDWGLLLDERGGIVGVHSRHEGRPIRTAGFAPAYRAFRKARSYRDWQFSVIPMPAVEDEAGGALQPREADAPSTRARAASAALPGNAHDGDEREGNSEDDAEVPPGEGNDDGGASDASGTDDVRNNHRARSPAGR